MEADEPAMYSEVIAMQSPTMILAQTTAVVIPSGRVGIPSTFARQQNMEGTLLGKRQVPIAPKI
jgi:hypothetical protein